MRVASVWQLLVDNYQQHLYIMRFKCWEQVNIATAAQREEEVNQRRVMSC